MQPATKALDDEKADTLPPPPPVPQEARPMVRILLVEPSPIIRVLIQRALTTHGYEVHCAGSLEEASNALAEDPELVLCELNLADGSGDTVCAMVRERLGADVPVVLMSSGPEQELTRRSMRCGSDRSFSKPRGLSELLPLVHELALE
jgi:DNA-binding response OmpR family regulator